MEDARASHQADQGQLQGAMDSLQTQSICLHRRQQHWAWQLAALLHWKLQGALQLRKILHSWATLTAASRLHQTTALHKNSTRSNGGASRTGSIAGVSEASGCRGVLSLAPKVSCTAEEEDGLPGLPPVPDGRTHHNRRVVGACFKGMLFLAEWCFLSWFVIC